MIPPLICNLTPANNTNTNASCQANFSILNYPGAGSENQTIFTGVRHIIDSQDLLVSGTYQHTNKLGIVIDAQGFIFHGNITSGCGRWYNFSYPETTFTFPYGPNSLPNGQVQLVGGLRNQTSNIATTLLETSNGFLYQGDLDGSGTWQKINPQPLYNNSLVTGTIVHSVMGNFAVGNNILKGSFSNSIFTAPFKSFIYDIEQDTYYLLAYPGSYQTTAYGIWKNDDDSNTYTIAGGYANNTDHAAAFLVDFNANNPSILYNWQSYYFDDNPSIATTHFEGITTDGSGGYNLAVDVNVVDKLSSNILNQIQPSNLGAIANIKRNLDGSFGNAIWTKETYSDSTGISSNTVINTTLLGVTFNPPNTYIATFDNCIYNNPQPIISGTNLCFTAIATGEASNQPNCPISYRGLNYPGQNGSTMLTGIRTAANDPNSYSISGYYTRVDQTTSSFIFKGLVNETCGVYFDFNFPSSENVTVTSTTALGVDDYSNNGIIDIVGEYTTAETDGHKLGFFYTGFLDGTGDWHTLNPQVLEPTAAILDTHVLNMCGQIIVGSYSTQGKPGQTGFIYQTNTDQYYKIIFPAAQGGSTTINGVWYNWVNKTTNGQPYTFAGSYTNQDGTAGYIADWNDATNQASHWRNYPANNDPITTVINEFRSVASDYHTNNADAFNLASNWINNGFAGSSFVNIKKAPMIEGFGQAKWVDFQVPASMFTYATGTDNVNATIGYYLTEDGSQYGFMGIIDSACIYH